MHKNAHPAKEAQDVRFHLVRLLSVLLRDVGAQSVGNLQEIVGQDAVDAHVDELLGLVGIIRPEHVAADAVRMRLVDHLLIEVGLEQLNLLRAQLDGAVNNAPLLTLAEQLTDADRNIGRIGLELSQMNVRLPSAGGR